MNNRPVTSQNTDNLLSILQLLKGSKDDYPNQQDFRYPPTRDKTREHVQKDTDSKEDHSGKTQTYIGHTHKQADNDSSTGKKLDNLAGSNPTSSLPQQGGQPQPQPQQGGQPGGGQPQPQQGQQKTSDQNLADLLKDYEDKKDQENGGGIKHHHIKHNKRHHAAVRNHEIVTSHNEQHDHDNLSEDQKVGGLDEFTNQHGDINNETV